MIKDGSDDFNIKLIETRKCVQMRIELLWLVDSINENFHYFIYLIDFILEIEMYIFYHIIIRCFWKSSWIHGKNFLNFILVVFLIKPVNSSLNYLLIKWARNNSTKGISFAFFRKSSGISYYDRLMCYILKYKKMSTLIV